jgi:diguanylate cyclase (GGDEF)-like protein
VSTNVESRPLDEIAASADEMLTLYDLARALTGLIDICDSGDIIAKHLKRLIPFSLCVFYIYDSQTDELEARHAVGRAANSVRGLRLSLGQRLTGWVAANRQTIANSDPVLDLGDTARAQSPRLRSCLSTPLISGDALIGVVSLYSSESAAFTDDHRRIIEVVSKHIAHTIRSSAEIDTDRLRDPLTKLPTVAQLDALLQHSTEDANQQRFTMVLIDVLNLKKINVEYGRAAGDAILQHVAKQVAGALRVEDILFRAASDEFVAFLHASDRTTVEHVANRICQVVAERPVQIDPSRQVIARVATILVWPPANDQSLADVISAARAALAQSNARSAPSVH